MLVRPASPPDPSVLIEGGSEPLSIFDATESATAREPSDLPA